MGRGPGPLKELHNNLLLPVREPLGQLLVEPFLVTWLTYLGRKEGQCLLEDRVKQLKKGLVAI